MIKGFKNSWVVFDDGIKKANIIVEDGRIKSIGNDVVEGMIELPENLIVSPGFIDEHIHGCASYDTMDASVEAIEAMAKALAKEGTTAFLATTMTQSKENIDKALVAVKEYMESNNHNGAMLLGVHLEGPFISKAFIGAQPIEHVETPNVASFKHYNEVSGNNIKLVTVCPEDEGALELISYLHENHIVASAGHTNATYEQIEKGIEKGLSCVTHTYNAQKPIHHREVGTVGAAMLIDSLNCEAICDGIHLCPNAIRLLWKNKPADKFTLVTDAMRAKGIADGKSELGGQVVIVKNGEARLENGTLAGSVLLMNKAVSNITKFLDIPLHQAIHHATISPAKNLSVYSEMGSIEVNKLANFTIIDKDANVYETYVKGELVYKK